MSTEQESLSKRFSRLLLWGSSSAIATVIFAVPGFLLVYSIFPEITGYYLIAAIMMAAYMTVLSLDRDRIREPDLDLSELTTFQTIALITILLLATFVGMAVRLGIAMGIAVLVETIFFQPLVAIAAAMAYPLIDRQIADVSIKLSPSALAALFVIYVAGHVLIIADKMDGLVKERMEDSAYRFGPI